MRLTGIATRAFNTPLMIEQRKLDVIVQQVILPRLGQSLPVDASYFESDKAERKPYAVTADGIAVIEIADTLVRKASGLDAWSGLTSYESLRYELSDAANDAAIRGILLDIDSPGGEVSGLFDLADFVYSIRGSKPIFAACEMACSAAYALASSADKVFVTRTGCVGSIGVVCCHVDQSEFDKKVGLRYSYIYAGAKKVDGNPHEPLSDRAQATFQAEIDRVYDMFVGTVTRNRSIGDKAVRAQEAGVYFGEQGVAARLADFVGGREDALSALMVEVEKNSKSKPVTTGSPRRAETEAPTVEAIPVEAPAPEAAKPKKATDEHCDPPVKDHDPDEDEFPEDPNEDEDEDKKKGKKAMTEPVAATAPAVPQLTQAQIVEIDELCELAGHPDRAIKFVRGGVTPEQVRKELHTLRAEKAAPLNNGLLAGINPNRGSGIKAMLAEAETFASEKGTTKQQAFAQMLEANPQVYAEHKKAHRARAFAFSAGADVDLN